MEPCQHDPQRLLLPIKGPKEGSTQGPLRPDSVNGILTIKDSIKGTFRIRRPLRPDGSIQRLVIQSGI